MAIKGSQPKQSKYAGANDISLGRTYFDYNDKDGKSQYVVKVLSFNDGEHPKTGQNFFGGDYEVLVTDNDNVEPGDVLSTYTAEDPRPKNRPFFFKDIAKILYACDPDIEDLEKAIEAAVTDEQPYAGKIIVVDVTPSERLDKAGRPYPQRKFMTLKEAGIDPATLPKDKAA